MVDSPAARAFIEQILAQTGTDQGLDEATREELIVQMLQQLTEMVNAEVISTLNTHQMRQLEHLLDTNQEGHIDKFLDSQGISRQEVVARVMRRFQLEYLGS